MLANYFCFYNWARSHGALGVTPAMAAGAGDRDSRELAIIREGATPALRGVPRRGAGEPGALKEAGRVALWDLNGALRRLGAHTGRLASAKPRRASPDLPRVACLPEPAPARGGGHDEAGPVAPWTARGAADGGRAVAVRPGRLRSAGRRTGGAVARCVVPAR